MSNGNKATKSKKGIVVNRRMNHTINTDVAKRHPKWEDVGGADSPIGILKLKNAETETYIRRNAKTGRWENVSHREVKRVLGLHSPTVSAAA